MIALVHSHDPSMDIYEHGLKFLLGSRHSEGWGTTTDTPWASMAASEISFTLSGDQNFHVDAVFRVWLNGKEVKSIPFDTNSLVYKYLT